MAIASRLFAAEPGPKPTEDATVSNHSREFKIQSGVATKRYELVIPDFGQTDSDPAPVVLIFGQRSLASEKSGVLSPQVQLAATFMGVGFPQIYSEILTDFGDRNPFYGKLGLELFLRSMQDVQPWKNSAFSSNGAGLIFGFGLNSGFLNPFFEYRVRSYLETKIADREGLATNLDHDMDQILRVGAHLKLGSVTLVGQASRFILGKSSIASKEFGIGLRSQAVTQFMIGLNMTFDKTVVGIKGLRGPTPSQIDDVSALAYQAASFFPDYILAEEAVFVEVGWKY